MSRHSTSLQHNYVAIKRSLQTQSANKSQLFKKCKLNYLFMLMSLTIFFFDDVYYQRTKNVKIKCS